MTRKFNGFVLPKGIIINNQFNDVGFSKAGELVYIKDNKLYIEDIPKNGTLNIGGVIIKYSNYGSTVSFSSPDSIISDVVDVFKNGRQDNSIVSSNSVVITQSSTLEEKLDKSYGVDNRDTIIVTSKNENIKLKLHKGPRVFVNGYMKNQPSYSAGKLSIKNIHGSISLPEGLPLIAISANVRNGNLSGDIFHAGMISSRNGLIELDLYTPLKVVASSKNGSCDVFGMVRQSGDVYLPPKVDSVGMLSVNNRNGNIPITYKGDKSF